MAKKRMFSQQITQSDSFMEMPLSTQALYFHLGMNADDDGMLNSPKMLQRMVGASEDDLKLLIAKHFVIPFETGVMVIKHWKINNYIRKDRYTPTVYTEEMNMLTVKENGAYSLPTPIGIPNDNHTVYQTDTQYRLDKNRLNKSSSRGGEVNILDELSPEETEKIFATYEDADYLIDAVEDEINLKMKGGEIQDFYRYIIGFANNTGWEKSEQQTKR